MFERFKSLPQLWSTGRLALRLLRDPRVPTAAKLLFGATVNDTGSSPNCGIDVVTVIQGTSDTAIHMHASCVGPPHVYGSDCCTTLNWLVPPGAPMLIALVLTA